MTVGDENFQGDFGLVQDWVVEGAEIKIGISGDN